MEWDLRFQWKYSDDDLMWHDIENVHFSKITAHTVLQYSPYKAMTVYHDEKTVHDKKHQYWRWYGIKGTLKQTSFVNSIIFVLNNDDIITYHLLYCLVAVNITSKIKAHKDTLWATDLSNELHKQAKKKFTSKSDYIKCRLYMGCRFIRYTKICKSE